ncbi:MAG: putative porin [Terrimicrobiaceae bacterium]
MAQPTPVIPEATATPLQSPVVADTVEKNPAPEPVAEAKPTAQPVAEQPKPAPEPVAEAKPTARPIEGPLPVASKPAEDILTTTPDLAPPSEPASPSQSVTINLINKLVQRGILTKEDAREMITQAQAEAETARAQAQADMFAVAQIAAVQAASDQIAVSQAQNAPASEDDVRVTYIPEPVKMQIKEEIKLELATDRASSKWANNVLIPKWVDKVHPFFDLRVRYEGDYFPNGNDVSGAFPNFNAINTGAPFDTTGNQFAPQLNADQNRNQFRIRARFGADINMGENFTSGFRVATGQNNSPVSTNQSLGLANSATQGQGGNFSKYALWLDRAFLRYDLPVNNKPLLTAWLGRFDNPFFSTRLIWDEDLGWDGGALKLQYDVLRCFTPFVTAGAFVVYNTDFNFSSNQPVKFQSYDKYLYAIQGGFEFRPTRDWKLKVAASYYYFKNIEGKLSTPYTPQTINDASDTDNSRPSFAQKGNTYMAIRNIVPDASNDFGAINQWQYYGLATKFEELALTARLDYNGFEPVQISIIGEYVKNLAWNSEAINLIAVNNRGAVDTTELSAVGPYEGDPTAWLLEMRVGTPTLSKRWDWSIDVGYRWIGSDAVVDGFNDSDFGLGGTNMKGFTVGGYLALSQNVYISLRWMGADSIAGPQYKTNIFQIDVNSKF